MAAPDLNLEHVLQSSADGFVSLDANFRIIFANRKAAELLSDSDDPSRSEFGTFLNGFDAIHVSETLLREKEFAQDLPLAQTSGDQAASLHLRIFRLSEGYGVWLRPAEAASEQGWRLRAEAVGAQASAISDSMRSGLILIDGSGSILKMNPVALEMFGVPTGASINEHVADFEFLDMRGEKLERANWPLERALRGESARDLDIQVRSASARDGEPWIASFNTNCIYDDAGTLQYVVALVRDVSVLHDTERALHESEDRHLAAMEAAHLGTWTWDIERDELHWSDRCRILYGMRSGTRLTVDSYRACIHPEDREKAAASTRNSLARPGELIEAEYRVVWADGSVHWLQSWKKSRMGRHGRPEGITGVVVGVDDRKAVEEELHRTAGALRAIIDGSPMGIVATDAEGTVKIWNPAAERTLGFARETVIEKVSPLLLGSGPEIHDREYRVRRADGREIEILCSVAPISVAPKDGGELRGDPGSGSVAMFLDITERQRLRRRAEHAQKMESLSVLAGGVAHDFNNLLTGILGNASLSLYSMDESDENYELVQEILRAGERAAALTRQLLAYTGQGRFSVTPLDLSELAREITSSAQLPSRRLPISIQLDLEARMPFVEADAGQLQQVLLSLIINSAEAIDGEAPGRIWIRTRSEWISESAVAIGETGETLPPGRYAVLEVEDTGAGMDAPTLARIFEPFFSTKFTGRGLGLPAALGIVRQHRGAIVAQSTPGSGSIFCVYLPQLPDTRTAAQAVRRRARGAGQILVVDDEETVRTTIRRSLEHWGYQVVLAENGKVAVDVFPEIAPQLRAVLLDLTMPVMGGEEALGHFRRIQPHLPVILISGYGEAHSAIPVSPEGPSSFLQKPFTPEQLSEKLFEVLDS